MALLAWGGRTGRTGRTGRKTAKAVCRQTGPACRKTAKAVCNRGGVLLRSAIGDVHWTSHRTAQYTMLLPFGRDTVHCLYGVMNSLTSPR